MGAILSFPPGAAEEVARLRRSDDMRQGLRLRVDRRARELAARHQTFYFRAILSQIDRGALDPELIEVWEPFTGPVQTSGLAR